MIKGISFLRPPAAGQPMTGWRASFPRWDLRPAKGGNEENSRGASFLAPLGNLEFVDGQFPSTADVLVEVTALDAVHQAAAAGCARKGANWPSRASPPSRKPTGSRASSPSSPSRVFRFQLLGVDRSRSAASRWPSKAISPPPA
jgi:hypothetical protein